MRNKTNLAGDFQGGNPGSHLESHPNGRRPSMRASLAQAKYNQEAGLN